MPHRSRAAARPALIAAPAAMFAAVFAATFISPLALPTAARAQNVAVTVNVDAAADRHPISPGIYGVAFADPGRLRDLNVPLSRYGGNNTSRYNWQLNADNRGSDWYFESIGESDPTPGARGDQFISANVSAGAQSLVTIPIIDWIAKLGPGRGKLASFSIAKYGAQTGNDWQWFPDAGNGILASTGQYVTGNDPNDANVPNSAAFEQGWVQHLVNTWGTAANGGLKYYILDNEPSIWHGTHRDVHPTGATMDEILQKTVSYAGMIKSVDPTALVVGPEEWGWSGYFFSGYDQQYGNAHGWSYLPDRANHGGWDYLPWYLDQLRRSEASTGRRLLDVFSVHYYPQGGEFSEDYSTTMQLRRNRSTRSLWDPNYVDESWIGTQVMLIPRLKSWVNTYYPGTKTAITEYNWGAEGHINGATTQADILGIFGREGLDVATRWTTPNTTSPVYQAIKIYRNYDGSNSTFGDTSVQASAPNPDNLSAFAAIRASNGALTVMVVNKVLSGTTPVTLNLANFGPGSAAQVWQFSGSSPTIARLADATIAGGQLAATVPAQSVTLFVVPAGPAAGRNAATFVKFDTSTQGNWTGAYGSQGYAVLQYQAALPAYAAVSPSGAATYTWAGSTSDVRGLQKPNASDRIAGCWYAFGSFNVDINLTDGQTHQVAFYCVDWDSNARSQRIDVLDAATGATLDSRALTAGSYAGGTYAVWNLTGHVALRFTNTGPTNAVLSGLFFDPQSSPGKPGGGTGNSVSFVGRDDTTQGSWIARYGTLGYGVLQYNATFPSWCTIGHTGDSGYTWAASTGDVRALQKPNLSSDRIAGCWYSFSAFTLDVNFSDGQQHQLALYCLDWDSTTRGQTIDALDAATGATLDSRSLAPGSFVNGSYLVYRVQGHVQFRFTNAGQPNVVLSGMFVD